MSLFSENMFNIIHSVSGGDVVRDSAAGRPGPAPAGTAPGRLISR